MDTFIKGVVDMRLLDFLEDYDEHVSLGGTCRVSLKLKEKGFRKGSYPFDWIVISLSQLTDALDNDFDGWVGCEYRPVQTTSSGLDWAQPYGIQVQA